MMKKTQTAGFYDEYVERQLKTGANERLISLYKRLLKLGLKKNSNVLELGCGVGIFTKLLSKKISSGRIEAVDLSEKSIEVARRQRGTSAQVHFAVGDVVNYSPKNRGFDFITLLDVIEHIPLDEHAELFQNLARICTENTLIVINIPNPEYLAHAKIHQPETLQILEEEVELLPLLKHCQDTALELVYFEKYGIWEDEDYHFLVLRKKRQFELKHLSARRSIPEKALKKMSRKIDEMKYR